MSLLQASHQRRCGKICFTFQIPLWWKNKGMTHLGICQNFRCQSEGTKKALLTLQRQKTKVFCFGEHSDGNTHFYQWFVCVAHLPGFFTRVIPITSDGLAAIYGCVCKCLPEQKRLSIRTTTCISNKRIRLCGQRDKNWSESIGIQVQIYLEIKESQAKHVTLVSDSNSF